MMKRSTLLPLMSLFALSTYAQDDITSTYVQNPSFELDDISSLTADGTRGNGAYSISNITGWTLAGSYGVSDIMTAEVKTTDDNFGAPGSPADGSQMYYVRHSWKNTTATLLQQVTLPAGKYRLAVDNKCVSKSAHTVELVAGDFSSNLSINSSMPTQWNTSYVDFSLKQESSINIGLKMTFYNLSGISVIVDNFRLYDMANYVEPEQPTEDAVSSYTEGVITPTFVNEADMKADLLQMLANFTKYMSNDWTEAGKNIDNAACGYFKGEDSGANNEKGVRPNADLSMICSFLVKYGKPANVSLPEGITWDKIEDMAKKSLVYAYSTHKANKLKTCTGSNYWGSTSTNDYVWESSLWAMSVAYSAYFQWDSLDDTEKKYIYNLLKAECNYELYRDVPTGYSGDTKAEENGWEADILAATLGLFPDDALADKWFDRLRMFAINSYSHSSDASNNNVIDPEYDSKTVADYYKGANLYDDYALQNHNLFHTSYQNVVMQELGEAALALKMFQTGLYGNEKWKTNALMHNNQKVQDNILNWLALADGELAMPNGNDWSLFLYDQITSYSTQACFQRDANALMLENLAYKYIKARQQTTTDGSWLLRSDVGARRMGVEAHRVMMTFLMHDMASTNDLMPTDWQSFNAKHSDAMIIRSQNIVRASTDYRFTCFSWSTSYKSYTGYFASNSADKNKIVVPYRANNTGNIVGWYDVNGKAAGATPVTAGIYELKGNSYVMNGELNLNSSALNSRFAIYSTPKNALIYIDQVTANTSSTITADKIGLLAISTDEFMKEVRTLYYGEDDAIKHKQSNGSSMLKLDIKWVNIDNELGVISNGNMMAFGDRSANNSIYTSNLYPVYNNKSRSVSKGDVVDNHAVIYYSLVDAAKTKEYAERLVVLKNLLPDGWNGVIAADEGMDYILISNFCGTDSIDVNELQFMGKAPVFYEPTEVISNSSNVRFVKKQNHSIAQPLSVMIEGSNVVSQLIDDMSAYITATNDTKITLYINDGNSTLNKVIEMSANETVRAFVNEGAICVEAATLPTPDANNYSGYIINPSFDGNSTFGWNGSPTMGFNCAEKFNITSFDVYQTINNLPQGMYKLTCQGFYRYGSYTNAATTHKSGKEALNAMLYGNGKQVPLNSIMDETNSKPGVGVNTSLGYVPNTMDQADVYFADGLYLNELTCYVGEDGVLRIGIRKSAGTTNDWTIFDNFTLTYLGEGSPDNIENTTVTKTDNDIYDMNGRRHMTDQNIHGLYIKGGKVTIKK